jgi:hypothetical protein
MVLSFQVINICSSNFACAKLVKDSYPLFIVHQNWGKKARDLKAESILLKRSRNEEEQPMLES